MDLSDSETQLRDIDICGASEKSQADVSHLWHLWHFYVFRFCLKKLKKIYMLWQKPRDVTKFKLWHCDNWKCHKMSHFFKSLVQSYVYLLCLDLARHYSKGQDATTKHFNTATMEFLEQIGLMRAQGKKWFDHATNCELPDGSKEVCRLKQTCTPLGAARKYVTTITDVHILNNAVSLQTCRIMTNTQGVWKYKLPLTILILKLRAKSAIFMSDLEKMPRQ